MRAPIATFSVIVLVALQAASPLAADEMPIAARQEMALIEGSPQAPEVRRKAVVRLAEYRHPAVAKFLRRLASDDPDAFVRIAALEGCVAQSGRDAIDFLMLQQSQERHLKVRETLDRLLQGLRPLVPFEELEQRYASAPGWRTRSGALTQAARHAPATAWPLIWEALTRDASPRVRAHALGLAMQVDAARGRAAAEALLADAKQPEGLRGQAAELLARVVRPPKRAGQLLLSALAADPGPALRLSLIRGLRQAGWAGAVEPLLKQLPDAQHGLRAALIETLAALLGDSKDTAATARLVAQLDVLPDLDGMQQDQAEFLIKQVGRFGTARIVAGLIKVLEKSTYVSLSAQAAQALARIGGADAEQALLRNLPLLPDPARTEILRGLQRIRNPDHVPQVVAQLPLLNDSPKAGASAVHMVAGLAQPADVPILIDYFERAGAGPLARHEVVRTIGWTATPQAFYYLLSMIARSDRQLSPEAAKSARTMLPWLDAKPLRSLADRALRSVGGTSRILTLLLGFSGHPSAREALTGMLGSLNEAHRAAALQSLALLGPPSPEALALARKQLDDRVRSALMRRAALFAIGRLGDASDLPRLKAQLAHASLRMDVAQAISRLGLADGHSVLKPLWRGQLGKPESRALYHFWSLLPHKAVRDQLIADAAQQQSVQYRELAVMALGLRRDTRAVLESALRDNRAVVRAAAAQALAQQGDAKAAPAIIARLELERPGTTRTSLIDALGQLGGKAATTWIATRLEDAVGSPDGLALLGAAALARVPVPPATIRAIYQADTSAYYFRSGMFLLLGSERMRRWVGRDLRAPYDAHRAWARRALRLTGDKAYYAAMLRRAYLEPYPRFETRQLCAHLPDAVPRLGHASRPAQDAAIAWLQAWWKDNADALTWDAKTRRFVLKPK